jgi:hypothetical protein
MRVTREIRGSFPVSSDAFSGSEAGDPDLSPYGMYEVLTVLSEMFACPEYGLRLPDASHIAAAEPTSTSR